MEAQVMILIVASNTDLASLNIRKQILNNYDFNEKQVQYQSNPTYEITIANRNIELITLNKESIYAQDLPNSFTNLELIIFISRHSSLSGTPTLSVHTPGNLAEADMGGIPRIISTSPPNAMREALKTLMKLKTELKLDYQISYEATHHGPSLDVPTMFTELGSSPKEWKDPTAAEAVAHATMNAAQHFDKPLAKAVLGIGGPHYNEKFTRIALEKELAFGHIIPKYALAKIEENVLRQCIQKTSEKVETIILDWKGIKAEDKPSLMDIIKKTEMPYLKI
jgi:D-aminoacyl-tRNA deacylase